MGTFPVSPGQKGRLTKTRARSAWTWSKCCLFLSICPHGPGELEEQMVKQGTLQGRVKQGLLSIREFLNK